jgi:hypothetical protein
MNATINVYGGDPNQVVEALALIHATKRQCAHQGKQHFLMAIIQYQVEVGADYSTLTTVVDNVQNVSLTYGRQKPLRRVQRKHRQRCCALPKRLHVAQTRLFITGTWVRISVRLGTSGTFRQLFVGRYN